MSHTSTVAGPIDRSNSLGADARNTNYAGGNTSAKGCRNDPVTGEPVDLLWVKGSGGDLGTLKAANLAVLRLDRLRALVGCLSRRRPRGRNGPRLRLLPARQRGRGPVDRHRDARRWSTRPTSTICIRTPGSPWPPRSTGRIWPISALAIGWCGSRGGAPGFNSDWTFPRSRPRTRKPSACILGGHGITAWGQTSAAGRAEFPGDHPHRRDAPGRHRRPEPFGAGLYPAMRPCPRPSGGRRRRPSR